MTSLRHLAWFLALGLFWGISPSLYKHLSNVHMPITHTVVITGIGVGLIMFFLAWYRNGWHGLDPRVPNYGTICAFLMNIPFGLNLFLASRAPPTELAIIITLSPFFNYIVALFRGSENVSLQRLAAIVFGFLSAAVLIMTRPAEESGSVYWLLVGLLVPILYTTYNFYAAEHWPKGTNVMQAGAAESLASGLLMLPVMLIVEPPGIPENPAWYQYWIFGIVTLMWVVERIAYFTLVNEKGAVYTVQATYISTPASVIIAALFFGGGTDRGLWLSLSLLMIALVLNNIGRKSAMLPPTNPESHPG